MLSKTKVLKALKSSDTQEEAADKLGVSRYVLYKARKAHNLEVAAPRGYNC